MTAIPYLLLAVVLCNAAVLVLATRRAITRDRHAHRADVVDIGIYRYHPPHRAQPYSNRSTLVALPRSGRVVDSEA